MSEVLRNAQVGEVRTWEAPHVGRHQRNIDSKVEAAASAEEAYAKAFKLGQADGLAAGKEATAKVQTQLLEVLQSLQQPLQAADDKVVEKIAALAIAIAKRLVRRELRTDRAEVIGVVREALAVLPVGLPDIRLHLHPEDAKLVRQMLVPAQGDAAWHIVEDPVISRGGCRISSATSQVDATLESRLENVINSMLGDERTEDSTNAG
ncbi:MAG: flagellar assembly protein FliH [Gammaproteobacteria bacterium]|nr:flagellar assembly protein FliH [Gammaproteobacteria bacterium]